MSNKVDLPAEVLEAVERWRHYSIEGQREQLEGSMRLKKRERDVFVTGFGDVRKLAKWLRTLVTSWRSVEELIAKLAEHIPNERTCDLVKPGLFSSPFPNMLRVLSAAEFYELRFVDILHHHDIVIDAYQRVIVGLASPPVAEGTTEDF